MKQTKIAHLMGFQFWLACACGGYPMVRVIYDEVLITFSAVTLAFCFAGVYCIAHDCIGGLRPEFKAGMRRTLFLIMCAVTLCISCLLFAAFNVHAQIFV